MLKNHADFSRRALLLAIASIFSSAAMPLDIYQGPMVAERSMDPNVLYIHDDSGSMAWEYMPDESPSGGNLRASAFLNKQYYNPDITYQPPLTYAGGRLVTWGNMDQRCVWPRVMTNGFTGTAGVCGTTTVLTANNAVYYDYIPGFNSRIDNQYDYAWDPIIMIDGRPFAHGRAIGTDLTTRTWAGAPENNPANYEFYAFRPISASPGKVRVNGSATNNGTVNVTESIIDNRACPVLFKDVPGSRTYYNDRGAAPGLPGNPHATCRYSYRTGDVDFQSNYQNYTATAPYSNSTAVAGNEHGRVWCNRSGGYTDFTGVAQTRTCVMGKHVIGDTTGGGTLGTAATNNPVWDYTRYAGLTPNHASRKDHSLEHRVSKFVNDAGELVVEPTPRRRTAREEIRNFANWYSYYRTRAMAAKSGTSLAFANLVDMNDTTQPGAMMRGKSVRLGYDTINRMTNTGPGQRSGAVTTAGRGVVPFLDNPPNYSGKLFVRDFYDWVNALPTSGSTPLLGALDRAGQYLMNSKKPWLEYPPDTYNGAGSGETFGCRRAFTILMTHPYYNESLSSVGAVDKNDGPVIWKTDASNTALTSDPKNRYQYTRQSPFFGENPGSAVGNSLADVAMYYWNRDLQSTIPNLLAPTKKDPAFWQHMQTFTIGLGVIGRLSDTEVNNFLAEGSNKNILWTFPTGLDTDYEKVDDLMHAGLNGHGGTSAAEDAGEFVGKLTALLTEIAGQDGSNTSPAVPRGIESDSLAFEASYSPSDWTGELLGKDTCVKGDAACGNTSAKATDTKWSATEKLAVTPFAARRIFTRDGSSGSAVAFTPLDLSPSVKAAIDVDLNHSAGLPVPENCVMARPNLGDPPTGDACLLKRGRPGETAYTVDHLIDYLRGDTTFEDSTTGVTAYYNGFRKRTWKDNSGNTQIKLLGDIVNSSPELITNRTIEDNYDDALALGAATGGNPATGAAASYLARKASFTTYYVEDGKQKTRANLANREETVLVGAGDGMLHAFLARTVDSRKAHEGEEQFAYIPAAVHGILKKLADPQYALIDTLKHSFYVDGAIVNRDILLNNNWATVAVGSTGRSDSGKSSYFALNVEKASTFDTGDVIWEFSHSDLGVPGNGRAEMALLPDGKWVALFGNGYNSGGNKAGLFMVELASGAAFEFIDTGATSGGASNGLSTPSFVGYHPGDPTEVSTTNPNPRGGAAVLAYAGDLLGNVWKFDLVNKTAHKLLEATDAFGKPQPITAPPRLITVADGIQVIVGTGKFLEQSDVDNTDPQTIYSVRDNCGIQTGCVPPLATRSGLLKFANTSATTRIDYTVQQGFYLDLDDKGARVIDKATENLGNEKSMHIRMPTMKPSSDPCASSIEGFKMEFDPLNGKVEKSLFEGGTFKDGYILFAGGTGLAEPVTGGHSNTVGGADAHLFDDKGKRYKDSDPLAGGPCTDPFGAARLDDKSCRDGDKKGRQSWKQLR